jgi:hypothetical protein
MIFMAVMSENARENLCSPFVCFISVKSMTYEKSAVFGSSQFERGG